MASSTKRFKYVTGSDNFSDEEFTSISCNKWNKIIMSEDEEHFDEEIANRRNKTATKPKCSSKNAIIARQNRIRKKMYIQNLEKEVSKVKRSEKKLNSIIKNQSFLISELRKELKYVKNVLANSSDISNLMKNIRTSTA